MRRRKTVIRLRAVALHPEREAGCHISHPSPHPHCLHSDSLHLPPRTSFLLLLSWITTKHTFITSQLRRSEVLWISLAKIKVLTGRRSSCSLQGRVCVLTFSTFWRQAFLGSWPLLPSSKPATASCPTRTLSPSSHLFLLPFPLINTPVITRGPHPRGVQDNLPSQGPQSKSKDVGVFGALFCLLHS